MILEAKVQPPPLEQTPDSIPACGSKGSTCPSRAMVCSGSQPVGETMHFSLPLAQYMSTAVALPLSTVLSPGQRWFCWRSCSPPYKSWCERAQLSGDWSEVLRNPFLLCGSFSYSVFSAVVCVSDYIMPLICLHCSLTTISWVPHEWPGPMWKLRAWISGNKELSQDWARNSGLLPSIISFPL